MMGQYSGSSLMWCQQYDNMNEWCPDVQMVRLAVSSLKGPTRRLQECSHPARWIPLLHASNEHIIDYHPPDQAPGTADTWPLDSSMYHAGQKIFWCRDFVFVIRVVCVCPLDDAFACPHVWTGSPPPSPSMWRPQAKHSEIHQRGRAAMESGLEKDVLYFCF